MCLTWGQLLFQKSNWTGHPNYTKCEEKVAISPGRPKTMWPGDRWAVGCGQYLGTWWRCSSFFYLFIFSCAVRHVQTAAQCNIIEPGICETNLHLTMTIFYFIVSRFDEISSSSQIQVKRSENVEVVSLQIFPGLSYHHTNSIPGRTLSYHHTNSIVGRTLDMRICPTTTWT